LEEKFLLFNRRKFGNFLWFSQKHEHEESVEQIWETNKISVPQEIKRDFIYKACPYEKLPSFDIKKIMRSKVEKLSNNVFENIINELFPYSKTMTDDDRLIWFKMADSEPVVEIKELL
jgi:hypothetical protein